MISSREFDRAFKHKIERDGHKLKIKRWDGNGLPPVGTYCEVASGEEWFSCKVNYYDKKGNIYLVLYFQEETEGEGHIYPVDKIQFRKCEK